MLKSLENELNKFGEHNRVLVRHSLLKSKNGNFIIPKEREVNSGNIILFDNEYHIHNGSEQIKFEKIKNELNDQRTEQTTDLVKAYSEDFEIVNNFDFFKDKSANPNVKLLGKILDCLLTYKGWENWKSSWYNDNSKNQCITAINEMGNLTISNEKQQFFYRLNIDPNNLVYLDPKIDRKMGLVNLFKLKDIIYAVDGKGKEEQEDNLKRYLSNHSLSFSVRFEKNLETVRTTVAVEVPTTLSWRDKPILIKHSFSVQDSTFDIIVNQILARKKLLRKFGLSRFQFPKIGDIKREKNIWLSQGDGNVYSYKIENQEEIDFLEVIIGYIKNNTKKGKNVSWDLMEEIFKKMEVFYSKYENENAYVPSGPDTSKFTATKSGWIKFATRFTADISEHSGLGTFFYYGLQIGGNFTYGRPGIILEYILMFASKHYGLPKYDDGSKVGIRFSSGTNWSAVGIG